MSPSTPGPATTATTAPDYRALSGHARRARTRERILQAAYRVFAERGGSEPVIDDFIRAAAVARGTFYNHFDSVETLRLATSQWLEEDLMQSIGLELDGITDPGERLALGVRLWLREAETDPVWCAFSAKAAIRGDLVEAMLGDDLRNGARDGVFDIASLPAARDLVVGTIHEAMARMTSARMPPAFTAEIARAVYRGLGMSAQRIDAALARPIPTFQRKPRQR